MQSSLFQIVPSSQSNTNNSTSYSTSNIDATSERQRLSDVAVEELIGQWQRLNLSTILLDLDRKGGEIIQNQKLTLLDKQSLSDSTTLTTHSTQKIIDGLVKRLETAENYFLDVYSLFIDGIVDPLPCLLELRGLQTVRNGAMGALELENRQLRLEVARLNTDLSQSSQSTTMNNRLQERVKLLERQLQLAESKYHAIVEKGSSVGNEKEQLMAQIGFLKQREGDLLRQLQLAEAKSSRVVSETLSSSSSAGVTANQSDSDKSSVIAAYLGQIDSLERELSQSNHKLILVERELQQLRVSQESALSSDNYISQIRELQSKIDELGRQIEVQNSRHLHILDEKNVEISKLADAQITMQKLNSDLHERLKSFEDIKKELEIFKSLDFSEEELRDKTLSLEALTIQKNRKLQAELIESRTLYAKLVEEYEETKKALDQMEKSLTEERALVKSLENDMASLKQTKSSSDHTTSLSTDTNSNSMLQIITGQRDRLMQRKTELENESRELQSKLAETLLANTSLKDDNMKLYERIRYLTAFQNDSRLVVDERFNSLRNREDSATAKYRSLHDEKMDPFEYLNSKEQKMKIQRLPPHDRATLHLSRIILSNKYSRLGLLIYTIFLHSLVFGMIFWAVEIDKKSESHGDQLLSNTEYANKLITSVKYSRGKQSFCNTFCSD